MNVIEIFRTRAAQAVLASLLAAAPGAAQTRGRAAPPAGGVTALVLPAAPSLPLLPAASARASALSGAAPVALLAAFADPARPVLIQGALPRSAVRVGAQADPRRERGGYAPLARIEEVWLQRDDRPWPFEDERPLGALAMAEPSAPRADPPFYGRQQPERPKIRKHRPTADETERAKRRFLDFAEARQEIFSAPTWFEKTAYPELKRTVLAIAVIDEALTDVANGQEADIPVELEGDVIDALSARRAELFARYRAERKRIRHEQRHETAARALAREVVERLHREGLATPALERPLGEALEPLHRAYRALFDVALGKRPGDRKTVRALAVEYERLLHQHGLLARVRAVDAALAAVKGKAAQKEAATLYNRSIRDAKSESLEANVDHLAAREQAIRSGTVIPSLNLGKQIRPTCTMNMLRGLLASLGIQRSLRELILEARRILNDPFVGMTTSFDHAMQLRLFAHYGKVAEVRERPFENLLLRHGRNLRVRIEIGETVYKHSVILEGFYELGGATYVALRDSTSYFPTRMTIEDFGRLLTDELAIVFVEPYPSTS